MGIPRHWCVAAMFAAMIGTSANAAEDADAKWDDVVGVWKRAAKSFSHTGSYAITSSFVYTDDSGVSEEHRTGSVAFHDGRLIADLRDLHADGHHTPGFVADAELFVFASDDEAFAVHAQEAQRRSKPTIIGLRREANTMDWESKKATVVGSVPDLNPFHAHLCHPGTAKPMGLWEFAEVMAAGGNELSVIERATDNVTTFRWAGTQHPDKSFRHFELDVLAAHAARLPVAYRILDRDGTTVYERTYRYDMDANGGWSVRAIEGTAHEGFMAPGASLREEVVATRDESFARETAVLRSWDAARQWLSSRSLANPEVEKRGAAVRGALGASQ